MSQGSPGAWAPLDPTSGPSAPPNPFVHELHLSGLQRVKVRCGQGACGGLVGIGRPGVDDPRLRWVRGWERRQLRSFWRGSPGVRTWGRPEVGEEPW